MPFARLKFDIGVHRCSGFRSPSRKVASIPRPPGSCISRDRTRRDHHRSETTCASMYRLGTRWARASTPPTPQCASRTPTGVVVSPARTRNRSWQNQGTGDADPARVWWRWPRSRRKRRPLPRAENRCAPVDRSERIRTYNFPENRLSDHRTGFKAYNLETVLAGELDPVIQSCVDADLQARLESGGR